MKYFLRVKEITCDVRKDEVNEILRNLDEMKFSESEKDAVQAIRLLLESRLRLADLEMQSAKESVWE